MGYRGVRNAIFHGESGDPFKAWDASATFDYMPSQYITFRWEFDHHRECPVLSPGPAASRRPAATPARWICCPGFTRICAK